MIATSWSDDSCEAPYFASYFGLALFAYLDINEEYNEADFNDWLLFYTNMSLEEWILQGEFDFLPSFTLENSIDSTPSKYFLYQDLLMSHFAYYCGQITDDYDAHLDKLYEKFSSQKNGDELINKFYAQYAKTLRLKWRLPLDIYEAYNAGDKAKLGELIDTRIVPLIDELESFIRLRRQIWLREANPSGIEVLEYRIGGQIYRNKTTIDRLRAYINGEIDKIAELEEDRIDPYPEGSKTEPQAVHYNRALRCMSVNKSIW